MELAKRQTQSTAVERLSQNAIVQTLAGKQFDKVAASLPSKIEGTFDLPKVGEMILATGEQSVCAFVEFELIKLAERINVGGNLNDNQIQFIAAQLIGMYPNETIADFKICFERLAMGRYVKQDKVFKLDGTEIGYAMRAYLDEKYQVLEAKMMKEKDDPYKPVVVEADPDTHQKWLNKLKEVTKPLDDRKVPPLTIEDVLKEGQERPKANFHPLTSVSQAQKHELHLEWVRLNFDKYTGDKQPLWQPEQEWIDSLTEEDRQEIFKKAKLV
jgi:hypothetical protein